MPAVPPTGGRAASGWSRHGFRSPSRASAGHSAHRTPEYRGKNRSDAADRVRYPGHRPWDRMASPPESAGRRHVRTSADVLAVLAVTSWGLSYGLTKLAFRGGGRSCSPARDSSPWRRSRSSCSPCSDDSARCSGRIGRGSRSAGSSASPFTSSASPSGSTGRRPSRRPAPHHRAALLPALPVAGRQRASGPPPVGGGRPRDGRHPAVHGRNLGGPARDGGASGRPPVARRGGLVRALRDRQQAARDAYPASTTPPAPSSSAAFPWRRSHWSTRADSRGARSR